jgi:hypothetical protein
MRRAGLLAVAMFVAPLAAMGCAAILGLDDPRIEQQDGSVATDAPNLSDAQPVPDGGDGGDAAEEPYDYQFSYNDITQVNNWEVYDIGPITNGAEFYWGGAFDGRWVYYAPSADNANSAVNVPLLRFDTRKSGGPFTNSANWEIFNIRSVDSRTKGFGGAVFDGRYVYYVPQLDSTDNRTGLVVRFDTRAPSFDYCQSVDPQSPPCAIDRVDLEMLFPDAGPGTGGQPGLVGFYGGVYDPVHKYVYFVPGLGGSHWAARLDTTKPDWKKADAWEVFDTLLVNPTDSTRGYVGGVFDGQYVYFIPYARNLAVHGYSIRHDTTKPFTSPSSWEEADTTLADPNALGFMVGGFDGRHVYYVPNSDLSGPSGRVTRYDTSSNNFKGAGTPPAGWEVMNLAQPDADVTGFDGGQFDPRGYVGSAFDGRYMYFVPFDHGGPHGLVAQYDTQAPFDKFSSWRFFDTQRLAPADGGSVGAAAFSGAVFDGKYVYFIPNRGSITVRFDARNTLNPKPNELHAPPPGYSNGSFF